MPLNLTYYGDPVLRTRAEPIEIVTDEVKEVAREMTAWMHEHQGFGLAAPQVGYSWRLFIATLPILLPNGHYQPTNEYFVFINPKLSSPAKETWTRAEACFSLPGIHAHVTRPIAVTVEAMDLEGNTFIKTLEGMAARIVMHENDHINGVLMIDRMPHKERRAIDVQLRKIAKERAAA